MSIRKIVFLDKNDIALYSMNFNDFDLLEEGIIAGFLSNPIFIEVDFNSEATSGWKYINGQAVR
jgi:hypothetical protein